MRSSLTPAIAVRSNRNQYPVIAALLVAVALAASLSMVIRGGLLPLDSTGVETNTVSSVAAPSPLLGKPELTSLRSSHARHYDLGNGRRVAVVGMSPLNYRAADGSWQPVQPGFQRTVEGWSVQRNTLRSDFSNGSTTVQLSSNGALLRWQPIALEINAEGSSERRLAVPAPGDAVRAQASELTLQYEGAWTDPTLVERFHSGTGSLKQELLLSAAPAAASAAGPVNASADQWLSLRVDLALPAGAQIFANGEAQTSGFSTLASVELRQADGSALLTLLPPRAYEQEDRSAFVSGRYDVLPHTGGMTVWVQTPLDWWLAPQRQYPAVLDPTMQVKQFLQAATIQNLVDNPFMDPAIGVHWACVGMCGVPDVMIEDDTPTYRRAYFKFKLPSLPDGAAPTAATLVAVPEWTGLLNHGPGSMVVQKDTFVHRLTSNWSYLLFTSSHPPSSFPPMLPSSNAQTIPLDFLSPDALNKDALPATTWDVTGDVQAWYNDPSTNLGFAFVFEDELDYLFLESPPNHCFPTAAGWSNLDGVVNNPSYPTTDGPGLGLLIEYVSPDLANNEMREVTVPSTQPDNTYRHQYHEYALPYATRWQLVGARGSSAWVNDGNIPNTPLLLTEDIPTDPVLSDNPILSDAGTSAPGNEAFDYKPNYILVNSYHMGAQTLPNDLVVRVQADNQGDDPDDDKKIYHLQIADALPAPTFPEIGTSEVVPIHLGSGFLVGQEFQFPLNTTVEIKIPYPPGFQPHHFNLQLFAPTSKYGSRSQNGMQLMAGPGAWEIEFQVKPEHTGKWFDTWLLAVVYDHEFPNPVTFQAQVIACENSLEVVRYPLDGKCIELQKPPTSLPDEQIYSTANVRVFSPAGFTGSCPGNCTTKETLTDGTKVAAFVGSTADDNRWVALKGGTATIIGGSISTSPDVRLIMTDFGLPTGPVTLPVLRGRFDINGSSGVMTPISSPNDTYLLVKSPLPEQDLVSGWDYDIDLLGARMRARGQLSRSVEPTDGDTTNFDFDATWSITARGGLELLGDASVSTISQGQFRVGTLWLKPPSGADYSMEHNPLNANASLPAVIPLFEHIRMAGATLFQPDSLGGAQVPGQGVILPPKQSVYEPADGGPEQVDLHCGDSCFDLRGEADAMTSSGPYTMRDYRMPDLIVQDKAGTVMFNTVQGVEIYSRDHPLSRMGTSGEDYSFSYEAFGASIRTYEGVCPKPRDPLNPIPPSSSPPGPAATILVGTATMSLPNAESDQNGPQISVSFTLCSDSLREMSFSFSTGDLTAIPLGNSGIFMNYVGGTISLTPGQGSQSGYTTVVLEVQLRGMSVQATSSSVFIKGVVTIDSRGLFDMQLQSGIEVFAGIGVGADGHFWVAWAPLDLGFEVQACVPYSDGFDPGDWPKDGKRCAGNELLTGSLRAHLWQGQGWQNQYHWLPDNDDLHIAARYEVSINIAAGLLIDWELFQLPPEDIQLYGIKLAFGEFCTNSSCTGYEWGAMGAYVLLGYDIGFYYGFDSGLDIILGSADYVLIDEAGQVFSSSGQVASSGPRLDDGSYTIAVPPGVPSAMFGLGWDPGDTAIDLDLRLQAPDGTVVDENSAPPLATVTVSPTLKGWQTIIVVDSPDAGEWDVGITSSSGALPDHNFVYFANNPVPSLELSGIPEPSQGPLEPGDIVEIKWTSDVSDAQTNWLSLYYTVTSPITKTQVIAGPIVERLPLTSEGSYDWQVQGLAYIDDTYHVYARIDSDVVSVVNGCGEDYEYNPDPTANVNSCSPMFAPTLQLPAAEITGLAEFTYEDWVAPATPTLLSAVPSDLTSVEVLWQPNNEVDLAGYLVRCTQGVFARTVRSAAVHTGDAQAQESGLVNGLLPELAATCSVRAYDTSGNISGISNTATAWPENPVTQVIIEPVNGGAVVSSSGGVTLTLPSGSVETVTLVRVTQQPTPPYPIGPHAYAGTAFDISAFDRIGEPVQELAQPATLEISYWERDWQDAGIASEESLQPYYWNGSQWQGLLPCEGCAHDRARNRFIVQLGHLTEFALLGAPAPTPRLYMPLLQVGGSP